MSVRLQKFLADAGVASRRKCEELIKNGLVTVNGEVAAIGASVSEGDTVEYNGCVISPGTERVVFAFYKPKNVICTSDENEDRARVVDYFSDLPYRLYTVGRLDFDSEGLIFVTNDGELANKLTHPRYQKSKTYRVLCSGFVTEAELDLLNKGVLLDDGMTAPAETELLKRDSRKTELLITIREGRNRQVRRMMAAVGHSTLRLCRVSIGAFGLEGLKPGSWRRLTDGEIKLLTDEPSEIIPDN